MRSKNNKTLSCKLFTLHWFHQIQMNRFMNIFLFIALGAVTVDAHTTALCTATSPDAPSMITVIAGTYHGCGEDPGANGVNSARIEMGNIANTGAIPQGPFGASCAVGLSHSETVNQWAPKLRGCTATINGKRFLGPNSDITCYKYEKHVGSNIILQPNLGNERSACFGTQNIQCVWMGALENQVSGDFTFKWLYVNVVLMQGGSASPCTTITSNAHTIKNIGVSDGGSRCVAAPPNRNDVAHSQTQACGNTNSGSMCAVTCTDTSRIQIGSIKCNAGSWDDTLVCSADKFCNKPNIGSFSAIGSKGPATLVGAGCTGMSIKENVQCDYSCTFGYAKTGTHKLVCDTNFVYGWGSFSLSSGSGSALCAPTPPPTKHPTAPTNQPTKSPTSPTRAPTKQPTKYPTKSPTSPTRSPTKYPTGIPSKSPTSKSPTKAPSTKSPTKAPTRGPSKAPTTKSPTKSPSKSPTTASPTSKALLTVTTQITAPAGTDITDDIVTSIRKEYAVAVGVTDSDITYGTETNSDGSTSITLFVETKTLSEASRIAAIPVTYKTLSDLTSTTVAKSSGPTITTSIPITGTVDVAVFVDEYAIAVGVAPTSITAVPVVIGDQTNVLVTIATTSEAQAAGVTTATKTAVLPSFPTAQVDKAETTKTITVGTVDTTAAVTFLTDRTGIDEKRFAEDYAKYVGVDPLTVQVSVTSQEGVTHIKVQTSVADIDDKKTVESLSTTLKDLGGIEFKAEASVVTPTMLSSNSVLVEVVVQPFKLSKFLEAYAKHLSVPAGHLEADVKSAGGLLLTVKVTPKKNLTPKKAAEVSNSMKEGAGKKLTILDGNKILSQSHSSGNEEAVAKEAKGGSEKETESKGKEESEKAQSSITGKAVQSEAVTGENALERALLTMTVGVSLVWIFLTVVSHLFDQKKLKLLFKGELPVQADFLNQYLFTSLFTRCHTAIFISKERTLVACMYMLLATNAIAYRHLNQDASKLTLVGFAFLCLLPVKVIELLFRKATKDQPVPKDMKLAAMGLEDDKFSHSEESSEEEEEDSDDSQHNSVATNRDPLPPPPPPPSAPKAKPLVAPKPKTPVNIVTATAETGAPPPPPAAASPRGRPVSSPPPPPKRQQTPEHKKPKTSDLGGAAVIDVNSKPRSSSTPMLPPPSPGWSITKPAAGATKLQAGTIPKHGRYVGYACSVVLILCALAFNGYNMEMTVGLKTDTAFLDYLVLFGLYVCVFETISAAVLLWFLQKKQTGRPGSPKERKSVSVTLSNNGRGRSPEGRKASFVEEMA